MAFGIDDAIAVGLKLIDKWFPSQSEKDQATMELFKLKQQGEFKEWEVLSSSDAGQVQINVEEAKSEQLFKSGWRPMVGWTCAVALAYQFILGPLASWAAVNLWQWETLPPLDSESLITLLFGMLGLGAYRTYEKTKGSN